ncbi:hypothetical protein T265_08013 [Opisthorchis viverrini]|uniref:WD domain, G-beta repeat protein n=1 Tax=Opisthorchis viverrini TaxID=6198 RepID=A0A074ZF63_OPIVI|nr:hypothetical protein T265_08013 [Opisthorchis viverrini]KER24272.1 hypothetical protein T265_08013 [Opisthorchis viverrini]
MFSLGLKRLGVSRRRSLLRDSGHLSANLNGPFKRPHSKRCEVKHVVRERHQNYLNDAEIVQVDVDEDAIRGGEAGFGGGFMGSPQWFGTPIPKATGRKEPLVIPSILPLKCLTMSTASAISLHEVNRSPPLKTTCPAIAESLSKALYSSAFFGNLFIFLCYPILVSSSMTEPAYLLIPRSDSHVGPCTSLICLPVVGEGFTRIVSGHLNGWIVMWIFEKRRPAIQWIGHPDTHVTCLHFWPDEILISQGRDGYIRFWTIPPETYAGKLYGSLLLFLIIF